MMKRITWSLLLTGLTSAVYAGQPGNPAVVPTGVNLIAPDTTGSWTFGIEGILVQSTAPQFQYAQIIDPPATVTQPINVDNQWVGQGYHAGFAVDATYHFQGNSRDVMLAFTHVDMNDGSSARLKGDQFFANNFNLIPDSPPARSVDIDHISGETAQSYNAIDLVFGQHFQINERVELHPFAGLRFANLTTRDDVTLLNGPDTFLPAEQEKQATVQIESEYEGLGPRVGIGATLHATPHISFVGQLGASLLIGNDNENITLQENPYRVFASPFPTAMTITRYKNSNNIYAVPELDARLGIDVTKSFSPTTSMNLQAGYMVTNYFDAIENDYIDTTTLNVTNNTENFGFQGPYIRFQLNLV